MLLSLKDDHKQHLSLLFSLPVLVLQDFCRLAQEFLKKGASQKHYAAAAQRLEVDVDAIRLSVEALVQILVESRRFALVQQDLQDSLLAIGFTEEQSIVLTELYENTKDDTAAALSSLTPTFTHYQGLEWRFDVQVASRSLLRQATPLVTLKLTLEDRPAQNENGYQSILLQTDPNNLKHITQKLEQALQEASGVHSRRIQRLIK